MHTTTTRVDPWEVLGIEPCGDVRRIKKAYADRLKHTNPEDDPEGFMELREAYEYLRALVSRSWETNETASTPGPEPAPKRPVRETPAALAPCWEIPRTVQRLMDRARTICRDDALRYSVDAWRSVIEDEAMWWVDVRLELDRQLFELVTEVDTCVAVWLLLDEEFRWRERGLPLEYDFVRDSVEHPSAEQRLQLYLRKRELFALSESRDPLLEDDRPFSELWVEQFHWFAFVLGVMALARWLA